MDLYTENILDHYQNPRHYGTLKKPTISAEDVNPLCGDKIHYDLEFQGNALTAIGFTAEGCAISKAAASMLSEWALEKTQQAVEKLEKEDVFKMIGLTLSPARVKCGLLGYIVFKKALTLLKIKNANSSRTTSYSY